MLPRVAVLVFRVAIPGAAKEFKVYNINIEMIGYPTDNNQINIVGSILFFGITMIAFAMMMRMKMERRILRNHY